MTCKIYFFIITFVASKDTILGSTINDYFENGSNGRLTAWVYPPITKTLSLKQIYLPQILK